MPTSTRNVLAAQNVCWTERPLVGSLTCCMHESFSANCDTCAMAAIGIPGAQSRAVGCRARQVLRCAVEQILDVKRSVSSREHQAGKPTNLLFAWTSGCHAGRSGVKRFWLLSQFVAGRTRERRFGTSSLHRHRANQMLAASGTCASAINPKNSGQGAQFDNDLTNGRSPLH